MYIINVLPKESYADCRIKGSINVPLAELEQWAQAIPKDTEIILYCAHYQCHASKKAWHLLHKLGFTNIRSYEGGIREWYQLNLPVEGACVSENLAAPSLKPAQEDPLIKTISAQELKSKL